MGTDVRTDAVDLFANLAKAQSFEDGNKRTALFATNGLLFGSGVQEILTIPVDEKDPSVADLFNDLLARAYIHNEHDALKELLRTQGLMPLRNTDDEVR